LSSSHTQKIKDKNGCEKRKTTKDKPETQSKKAAARMLKGKDKRQVEKKEKERQKTKTKQKINRFSLSFFF